MNPERFLVDTSIWVKYLRGLEISLKDRLGSLVLEERAFMSEVIIMEILRGAKSDREYQMLREDLLALPQVSIDQKVWEAAWKNSYKLRKSGINAPMADVLISSIAIYYKLTLMHSDKHFNLIAKHSELKAIEV